MNTATNQLLLQLIDRLSLPLDELGVRRVLHDFAVQAGFTYFAYLCLKGPETFALSNYPRAWHDRYAERGYLRLDPVVTAAKHGRAPIFTWSREESVRLGRSDVRALFADAASFGIRAGISISIPVGFRNRVVFSLAGERQQIELSEGFDTIAAGVAITLLHKHVMNEGNAWRGVSSFSLSPREAECLRWFAEGASLLDIAAMLKISPRSVRSYIDQATEKLGAGSSRQAASSAIRLGLI